MPSSPPHGLKLLGGIFFGLALLLAGRLIQLQILDHDLYERCATRQWECKVSLPAPRGNIFDRHGLPLAVSDQSTRVITDPHWIRALPETKREEVTLLLMEVLDKTRWRIEQTLKSEKRYVILGEGLRLDRGQKEALEKTGVLNLEMVSERLYPQGRIGAALIGFLGAEGQGASGLELSLEGMLAGRPGEAQIQTDDLGRARASARNRTLREPQEGGDVYLTLDFKLQTLVERELEAAALDSEAKAGCAVLLDPSTGEILAMASWPAPATRGGKYRADEWKLLPLQGVYEPGSTMKAVTSIVLMEEGGVTLDTQVDAEDGSAEIDGFTIRDDKAHPGWRSFREAFILSSNVCFAKFSQRVSDEALFASLRDLGFGNIYGLEYPGEQAGKLRPVTAWSDRSKLTLIFGQELSATPLQITSAVGAVAAEGELYKPWLIRALQDQENGLQIHEPVFLRKVCRKKTAGLIRGLSAEVVLQGTGTAAAVDGLPVGGKTGTAQKFNEQGVMRGKYLASFVGMVPVDDPRLVFGVFLDEPRIGMHHGGQSAAPAFARMVRGIAIATDYLPLPESASESIAAMPQGPRVPSFLEMDPATAKNAAMRAGLPLLLRGRGDRVVAQEPSPGAPLPPGEKLRLVLGSAPGEVQEPPDLMGRTLRDARRKALENGYRLRPEGSGIVLEQFDPEAGTIRVILGERNRG
jgi:cell division protein FtsI/penicillin-binding protein 2